MSLEEILNQLKTLNERVSLLIEREAQLRAVLQADANLDPHMDTMMKVIRRKNIADEVAAAIRRAPLKMDPFPYAVIDDVLPDAVYHSMLRGIPPRQLFTTKPGKEHMAVPFEMAPTYCHRVWRFIGDEAVPNMIAPIIIEKFKQPISDWIAVNWPDVPPESVEMNASGGRLMLRRRGYRIEPHRDPKWAFITCILYLARRNDNPAWGTQIFAVDKDQEAMNAAPHWIDPDRCHLIEDVAFLPNRLLVFLNSTGAHGAHIPEDAQPEDLERFIYQFRVGPSIDAIAMLRSSLPEERQSLWAGKQLIDY